MLFVVLSGTSLQAFHAVLRALESELGPSLIQWDHPQSLCLELLDLWVPFSSTRRTMTCTHCK